MHTFTPKFIWFFVSLEFILAIIAFHNGTNSINELILSALWVSSVAILLGGFISLTKENKGSMHDVISTIFLLTTFLSIGFLFFGSLFAIFSGPLEMGGIIIMITPIIWFLILIGGFILGGLAVLFGSDDT